MILDAIARNFHVSTDNPDKVKRGNKEVEPADPSEYYYVRMV
jgi:hypothetical protein